MKTERLLLQRFSPDDWQALFAYLSRQDTAEEQLFGVIQDESGRQGAEGRLDSGDFWTVSLKDTGKVIGYLHLVRHAFDTWELGYLLQREFWGKGYATEAAEAMLSDVFSHQNAQCVTALCDPLNAASWKLLERLGMRRKGHLVKNIWFGRDENGSPIWQDVYEYRIQKEEWERKTKGI